MLRKTDSNNPADWLFLAESDLEGQRELAQRALAYPKQEPVERAERLIEIG